MIIKDAMTIYGNLWKERYKVPYPWKFGKDSKLLKSCGAYFEGVYGIRSLEKYTEAVMGYLKDDDSILIKLQHPIGSFCQMPTRWVRPDPKKEVLKEEVSIPACVGDFKQRWLDYCASDPIKAAKGFKQTRGVLKAMNPGFYEMAKEILQDLLGKDRYENILTLPDSTIMD